MTCSDIRNLLSLYTESALDEPERRRVAAHLAGCADCRRQAEVLSKSWEMLGELDEIEPNPFYISRFYARLAEQRAWYAPWADAFRNICARRRLLTALAAACLVAVIGIGVVRVHLKDAEQEHFAAAHLNGLDPELFESFELAENLELINALEFLPDLEIIQALDAVEAS
jgi:predicted anti-sigma-YlaC factor YlaD